MFRIFHTLYKSIPLLICYVQDALSNIHNNPTGFIVAQRFPKSNTPPKKPLIFILK